MRYPAANDVADVRLGYPDRTGYRSLRDARQRDPQTEPTTRTCRTVHDSW